MRTSSRTKLFITKHKLKNSSEHSDAFVRMYNRSLRENYNTVVCASGYVAAFFSKTFGSESWFTKRVISVGDFAIRLYEKLRGDIFDE